MNRKNSSVLPTLPQVFTADEAARILKVSKCTVIRLANRGEIFGAKIGNQWRFSDKVLLNLFQSPLRAGKVKRP